MKKYEILISCDFHKSVYLSLRETKLHQSSCQQIQNIYLTWTITFPQTKQNTSLKFTPVIGYTNVIIFRAHGNNLNIKHGIKWNNIFVQCMR